MSRLLENYIKKHPEVKFIFSFEPKGASNLGDKRYWHVKFSNPIKSKSLIGYACETYQELIDHIVYELD